MELPEGAKKIQLKAGKRYSLCTCGKSAVLPFCNGAHKELNAQQGSNYRSFSRAHEIHARKLLQRSVWHEGRARLMGEGARMRREQSERCSIALVVNCPCTESTSRPSEDHQCQNGGNPESKDKASIVRCAGHTPRATVKV